MKHHGKRIDGKKQRKVNAPTSHSNTGRLKLNDLPPKENAYPVRDEVWKSRAT